LADERRAIGSFVNNDPLLRRFFDVFLFENVPASNRRADEVYLAEVDAADVYVGLFGNDYGFEDAEGISPTEREFDRATARGKTRLIFLKAPNDQPRHPKMQNLIRKAEAHLIRRRFSSIPELTTALSASLVEFLFAKGLVQDRPFEEQPCPDATLDDLDAKAVAAFTRRAREERQFPLAEGAALTDVLTHLNLLLNGQPTKAAVLLFGRNPQRFLPSAEVRCMHFHGTEVARPVPFYRIFKGNLFDQVDMAHDFVMSKLNRSVGTRAESAQAPVRYEIPPDVVREAIVNAIAHRDYASAAAVQVSVFADRFEVWNPGQLPPPLTPEKLRHPHSSIARNHRVCETLFLARYIEKFGTGTLMMIRECRAHDLPEPDFLQHSGEFVTTLWRDWLTDKVIAGLGLNERQRQVVAFVRKKSRVSNTDYQEEYGVAKRTAHRDLQELTAKGVLMRVGTTGKGTHYLLCKGAIKGPKGPQHKGATNGPNVPPAEPQRKRDIKGTSTQTRQQPDKPDQADTGKPAAARKRAPKGQSLGDARGHQLGKRGIKT
jgi:predicted HTH transcriptional regulator